MDPVAEEECCPNSVDMEEERGTDVEAHAEDVEEGTRWRADVEDEWTPEDVGK
jgi:hypothetical protein